MVDGLDVSKPLIKKSATGHDPEPIHILINKLFKIPFNVTHISFSLLQVATF